MSKTDIDIPDDELLEIGDGEFITTTIDAIPTFGGVRHILHQTGAEPASFSTVCNRKKAPRDITGRSIEVVDAYELLLNDAEVCPTCRNKVHLDNHVNWGEIKRVMREFEAGDITAPDPDDERIPVRAEFNVEIDFPPSAKYDLIEAARDLMQLGGGLDQTGLPPIDVEATVEADDDEEEAVDA